jgi:delta 1-pyrroline-5-carboxylate dehydrogenase
MAELKLITTTSCDTVSEDKEYLTTGEVRKLLGITRQGVKYLAEKGKFSYIIKTGDNGKKIFAYHKAEVEAYLLDKETTRESSTDNTTTREQGQGKRQIDDKILEENKKLLYELGRINGRYESIEQELYQTRNILTERADTLIEKEAKIKELEAKLIDSHIEKERILQEKDLTQTEIEIIKTEAEKIRQENERLKKPFWVRFFMK